ncbi:MAG: ATP-binding cassette domain-containing protein [Desulfobacterium sp.]|nr:ATP-binding cassette domain-containing protein [Desulfobacterium sp.]
MIQVENLTKYYNDFCAVDNLSFTINPGEILGLLGPNGAGKTTTLRMLTGFFKPTSGTIQVKDFSIPEETLKIKQIMGYLPESAPLYHNMLVFDYLGYVAAVKGIPRGKRVQRLKELSELCGLNGIMHRTIDELSKGLKQRVGLAHALMTDPEILVLDEPTSGLDPNQIAEIRAIIRRIGRAKTIIFSTHILSEAESTCDRIVIINRGKIVADDTTQNLKNLDGTGASIVLSLSHADPEKALALIRGVSGVRWVEQKKSESAGHCRFEIHCNTAPGSSGTETCDTNHNNGQDHDPGRALYLAIRNTDWIITELTHKTRSLETIFQELTRGN